MSSMAAWSSARTGSRRHTRPPGGESVPPGRCSVGLALLRKLVEPQRFFSDPELTGQLPPHPPARDRLAPFPCADRRRLDPEQQPELCLAQVPGLAPLAQLVHNMSISRRLLS